MSDTYSPSLKGIVFEYWECVKGHACCTRHAFAAGSGEGIAPMFDDWDY